MTSIISKILVTSIVFIAIAGCDSGGPSTKVEESRLAAAQGMRQYFDKVHGNYDQLSASDKDAYVKLAGGQQQGDRMWNAMKFCPGGAGASKPR